MPVTYELMLFGQSLDWFLFSHGFMAIDVINGHTMKDIDAAIDPPFSPCGFSLKSTM